MSRRRPRLAAAAVLLLLAGGLAGCRTSGLEFGRYQLRFTSPGQSSAVTLPLRLSWTAAGLYQPGDSYAVFVDTQPVGPGRSVTDLLPDACKLLPNCSRDSYYQQAGVWLTGKPSLVLTVLPASSTSGRGEGYHTITVVILDRSQVRTGEEFATLDVAAPQASG